MPINQTLSNIIFAAVAFRLPNPYICIHFEVLIVQELI